MLAPMRMPQEPPTPTYLAAKMSVAVLPSYSQSRPSPSKRPKLSLDTSDVPSSTFGKGSTSLRLETLSATSPTSRNTFRNAYKGVSTQGNSTSRPEKPVLTLLSTETLRATSEESDSSASSLDSSPQAVPYKVAYTSVSILSNSPLPRRRSRQLKTMFPTIKRVAFRTPLTEDVKNFKYILKHSDIESSTSTISTLELTPAESKEECESTEKACISQNETSATRKASPPPLKRESSDDEEDGTCPATPIAGRHKRSRQWTWTIGTVDPDTKSTAAETKNEKKELART